VSNYFNFFEEILQMSLLIFSPKCKHSVEVVKFISKHQQLQQIVQFHNVTIHGIPPEFKTKITRVPTMLTKNGKLLVGREIHNWLESLLPVEELETCGFGGINSTTLTGEPTGEMFGLDQYGISLQPPMTKELQEKISRKVEDVAYSDIKN
jgi:hypothetical protein|tara:strand:+ start:20289 stop:20741 length:453 start_codon:yes stop_codon:yes gene_type:complete